MTTIFCDWGTTNLRAYFLENGEVSEEYASDNGLIQAREIGFAKVLGEVLTHFDAPVSTPIYLSGMIGSKHGWKEAPYTPTPAGVNELKNNFVSVEEIPNVKIFGGVSSTNLAAKKDVMRGEEVQILGIVSKFPHINKVCLPGTHSKWAAINDGKIDSFSTWMTGDLFNSLSKHTIFKEQIHSECFSNDAFNKGVEEAKQAGPLLNSIFHLRTDYLFAEVSGDDFHSYLSGFLIGSEIKAAHEGSSEVIVCGSETMMDLYSKAMRHFGIKAIELPASEATVIGMKKLSESANG